MPRASGGRRRPPDDPLRSRPAWSKRPSPRSITAVGNGVATLEQASPFQLDAAAWARLERRAERAAVAARRGGTTAYASVTVAVASEVDLAAAVLASRRPGDRWFCFEQPDRDGYAVCGLGVAAAVEAAGPRRFEVAARACRAIAARVFADDPAADPRRPAGAGPVFCGGFAFAHDGGAAPEWESLAPAQLVLPELSLARRGAEARLTVTAAAEPGDLPGDLIARVRARLEATWPAPMPLLDPDPAERPRVAGAAPAAHYEEAVARAVERIRAGELDKVVLAREVDVHAPGPIDPAPVLDALRAAFPGCYCFCVGTPQAAFVGASPELLVRRDGERAQTVALAGTTRRSADPAVDDHLGEQLLRSGKDRGEQRIVTERIERALDPVSLWVADADEPVLVKVQNVQHLATPIRAQLAEPIPVLELAGRLHPTPAVGGEPNAAELLQNKERAR